MLLIIVTGTPGPQGSKRHVGHGRMIESSKKVKPWREAVKAAAQREAKALGRIAGPVVMDVTFTLPRPKSAKGLNAKPATRPDLSKLVRSTEDAITDAGAWEDDGRVVETISRKVYPNTHKDALDVPGAVIRLWPAA